MRRPTLIPTEISELLWREIRALSETHDPLLASAITEATIGGIAKPKARGHRPIVIGRVVTRCVVAHLVKRARNPLRRLFERGDKYGLTGDLPAVVRPFTMMAKCAGRPRALARAARCALPPRRVCAARHR